MAKILDMDRKYQIILIVLLFSFFLVIVGTVSASLLSHTLKNDDNVAYVINDGDLVINYINGKNVNFNRRGKIEYGVAITNTSKEKVFFSINLDVKSLSEESTVSVLNEEGLELENIKLNDKFDGRLVNLYSVGPEETVRYNKIFNAGKKLSLNAELNITNDTLSSEIFSDILINKHNPGSSSSRVGSEISMVDEGLIHTIDNKGTAYFFRGNVINNYVRLGKYLFRIVRVNGDNSIRLILDSSIGNYAYNTNTLVEGAHINTLGYLGNTTLVNTLNEWVSNELSEYKNYLTNGDYCMEMQYDYLINNSYYSTVYERIFMDNAPMLECSNYYTGIVGLLSVDEVIYAGAYNNNINTRYYLYNPEIEENYLTSSGYFWNNGLMMINVNSNGSLGEGINITEKAAVRPVITINSAAKVKGNGTKNDPYVIVS